jgi:phospholipid/cholesterol/gamma-HCH transport system substrate-binding protein
VLGALSLLLNGGGVAQLKTITHELSKTFGGREDAARSVLTQIRDFTATLDENKAKIVNAIEALNRLAISVHQQQGDIDEALEELPSALTSVNEQRGDLVAMLRALNRLGDVGIRVIKASKAATIDSFRQLQPVLTELSNSGDNFVKAINVFLTYPFVDEVVGRDPQVARNLHMGDYTNLSVTLDIDLTTLDDNGLPTTVPTGLPTDLPTDLPTVILDGLQACLDHLAAGGSPTDPVCIPLKEYCSKPANKNKQVCLIINSIPGPPNGSPPVTLPPPPVVPVPSVTGLPGGVGGLVGPGRTGTGPWNDPAHGGPTMGQLSAVYDPALVSLLVPGLVVAR